MNLRLSPSKYQCYEMCPLKFKFQFIDKLPTRVTPHLAFGSVVHDTIEAVDKLTSNKKTILNTYQILDDKWDPKKFDPKIERECRLLARAMLRVWFRWQSNNKNKLLHSEKWIELEIQGMNVLGKIDRIEVTPEGDYHVVDYKTGRDTENVDTIISNIQMNIYAMGVKQLYGKFPTESKLFYLKSNSIIPYIIQDEHIDDFTIYINDITDDIKQEKYIAKPGKHCGFCDYANICEFKFGDIND